MLTYTGVHLDRIADTGHAVLLLHAFPLSSSMWVDQLGALYMHRIPAIAPNIYGVEGSDMRRNWSFEDYIEELIPLLSDLGIRQVTITGLSMGGYQAFEFYRHYPDMVRSLVLCDTRAEADSLEALANRTVFIEAVRQDGPEEAIARMLPNVFSPDLAEKNPAAIDTFKAIVTCQTADVIIAAMEAIAQRKDSTKTLAGLSCPVTFITGKEDRLTPPPLAESMHKAVNGSVLHLIEEAGHLSNMEQPDHFNALLLDHLDRLGQELPGAL